MQPVGGQQPPGQPPQQPQYPPPPRRSHAARNIAIAIAVIVVIAFVAVEYRSSDVDITVVSNHITNTVTFTFAFDGRQIDSGVLGPGQKASDRVPLSWWFYDCQPHSFAATSTGGELGPETDSATLVVCSGTSYGTWLSV